jgi:hypothetical protein
MRWSPARTWPNTWEVENGKDQETKTKTEGNVGAMELPFLGVRSMKTLSATCR